MNNPNSNNIQSQKPPQELPKPRPKLGNGTPNDVLPEQQQTKEASPSSINPNSKSEIDQFLISLDRSIWHFRRALLRFNRKLKLFFQDSPPPPKENEIKQTEKSPIKIEEQSMLIIPPGANFRELPVESMTKGNQVYLESENVNDFGYYVDGWADIVDHLGERVDEVSQNVFLSLSSREIPDIVFSQIMGNVGTTTEAERQYILAKSSPGITTMIRFKPLGDDLFAAWSSYIKPVINAALIIVILLFSLIISGLFHVLSNDFFGYGYFAASITAAVFIFFLVVFLITMSIGNMGKITHRSFWYYFFVEPSVFDAEDLIMMNLLIHKTILKALDSSGIDLSKLRTKEIFQRGRRGEEI